MDHDWQTAPPPCLFPTITARWFHDTPDVHHPGFMTFRTPAPQSHDAPVSDDWRTISEELLQGLVHALNNRVAALSAFVELAKLGDEEGDSLTVLPVEIAQLLRVNALFALLPERKSEAEALELRAVLDDAIRLHEHHPRLRGGQVDLTFQGGAAVVRAPRWALVRVLVMLVHLAKRSAETNQGRGGAAIRVHGDDNSVVVHLPTVAAPSADLAALAARCGGRMERVDDEVVLTLPSLRALRRREREAQGEAPSSG
jgi:hypothetical protein